MGRQVVKGVELRDGTADVDNQGDVYVERLLKLIPSETVTLYIFLQGVIKSALSSPTQETQLQFWLWGVFFIVAFLNIIYLRRFNHITDPVQYVILTIALIIWVMNTGGPFELLSFYKPFMGSVSLGIYTFSVPIFYKGIEKG